MPIATEVAKVSGAVRCNRWGRELKGDSNSNAKMRYGTTLEEFFQDTAAYARLEREKIIAKLKAKRHTS